VEEGLEDTIADEPCHHPVESDECHRTIGVGD